MSDVASLLASIGLGQWSSTFEEEEMDLELLSSMDVHIRASLQELGLPSADIEALEAALARRKATNKVSAVNSTQPDTDGASKPLPQQHQVQSVKSAQQETQGASNGQLLPQLHISTVFDDNRFPNVVVTPKGTVILVYGTTAVYVRRSDDGGETWSRSKRLAQGIHSGGATVNEKTGDILVFVEDQHPPAPLHLYRSADDGRTWAEVRTRVLPDVFGHELAMHFNETGVTLLGGQHDGRLVRPARWYEQGDFSNQHSKHYTSAVFSDDGGATWLPSDPFPEMGTGEAALVQLSKGAIYYNTRRHWAPLDAGEKKEPSDVEDDGTHKYKSGRTRRRWSATSRDGASWSDAALVSELPDGPQRNNFGLFGGLTRLDPEPALGDAGIGEAVGCDDVLLYSNVDHPSERRNGALWVSLDGGKHWRHKRALCLDEFGYSSLAVGRPGTPSEGWVYCFYEGDRATRYFESGSVGKVARFNAAWLFEGYYVLR